MSSKKSNKVVKITIAVVILLLLCLLVVFKCVAEGIWIFKSSEEVLENLDMEEQSTWDGTQYEFSSAAEEETITIPGFSDMLITAESSKIKLFNYEENTVNFIYTIEELVDSKVIGSYTTQEEANTALSEQSSSESVEYQVSVQESRYNIVANTYSDIYVTKGIAPGNYVDWDVKSSLKEGEHKIRFCISTYDVTTNEPCYGANVETVITVQ